MRRVRALMRRVLSCLSLLQNQAVAAVAQKSRKLQLPSQPHLPAAGNPILLVTAMWSNRALMEHSIHMQISVQRHMPQRRRLRFLNGRRFIPQVRPNSFSLVWSTSPAITFPITYRATRRTRRQSLRQTTRLIRSLVTWCSLQLL